MFEKKDFSKPRDTRPYPKEVLNILADEISNMLKAERMTANQETKPDQNELFVKVSNKVFDENGVEKDFYPILRSQIGKILNERKTRLIITKKEKERMIKDSENLVKKREKMGIDINGDLMDDF